MKKTAIVSLSAALFFAIAIPSFAKDIDTPDPYVNTNAYIGESLKYDGIVRGKSYAMTSNSNMTKLTVQGTFYQSGTKKESGSSSTTTKNYETDWSTKDGVYSDSGSYTLNTASRTYFSGGKYAQDYASDSWN